MCAVCMRLCSFVSHFFSRKKHPCDSHFFFRFIRLVVGAFYSLSSVVVSLGVCASRWCIYFFRSFFLPIKHTQRNSKPTPMKSAKHKQNGVHKVYTELCCVNNNLFKSKIHLKTLCYVSLSLYLAFSSYFTLALAKFFCSLPSFRNQWLLAHRYFKRDSHSQARKTIKTKNKKRNKNRLPIGVPRAHTHTHTSCLFVRSFFLYFFVLFWSYIDVHINITTATSTNGKSNQPKFLFGFFSASFYAVFGLVFLAAALRFDVSTTLAIKSNLFFVVVAVVDVVVLRLTGQKFVQPNLYILVLNVAISSKCAHSSLCITSWQVQLKNSVNGTNPHPHLHCVLSHSLQL